MSLTLFTLSSATATISTPLTNALNAIGKIKTSLWLMVMWTMLTWILTPILIFTIGYNGYAWASLIISLTVVVVVVVTRKYIPFSLKHIWSPGLAAICMGGILYELLKVVPQNIFSLIGLILLGGISYLGIVFLLARQEVIADVQLIRKQFIH